MTKPRISIILAAVAACLMATSCSISYENTKNASLWQTNIQLNSDNYRIVKQISGESSATYIFGIGGLSKKALTESAISDMLDNAGLTGSQAIINTTYYVKTVNIVSPIYFKRTAYATAYVIEFVE